MLLSNQRFLSSNGISRRSYRPAPYSFGAELFCVPILRALPHVLYSCDQLSSARHHQVRSYFQFLLAASFPDLSASFEHYPTIRNTNIIDNCSRPGLLGTSQASMHNYASSVRDPDNNPDPPI